MDEAAKAKAIEPVKPSESIEPIKASEENIVPFESDSKPTSGKKGKKKKKKKLTAKEKQLEKLEKAALKLLEDHEKFNEFLKFMVYWIKTYKDICFKLLNKQANLTNEFIAMKNEAKNNATTDDEDDGDGDNEGKFKKSEENDFSINHEDFKAVLQDLNIPCTQVELHLLCKLLDRDAIGFIDYRTLTPEVVKKFINHECADGIRFITSVKVSGDKLSTGSPIFVYKLWKPLQLQIYPKYVILEIKLATFSHEHNFIGHIKTDVIYTHMTIFTLIEFVKQKTDVASTHVALFKDPTRQKSVRLDESKTIEECGYTGSIYDSPNEYTIFYDYVTCLRKDPILNCDHYFMNNKQTTKKNYQS